MKILKKLTFVPFLVISMVSVVVFADQVLQDPLSMVIGFEFSSMWTMLYLSLSLLLTAFFFALTVCLSLSWEIPIFAAGFASLVPLMMIQQFPVNMIFAGGFFLSFLIGLFGLLQRLRSYLTFSPRQILGPGIGLTIFLCSIAISVASYQVVSLKIEKEGFKVPQQLINMAVKFSGADSLTSPSSVMDPNLVKGESTTALPAQVNLSPEQIQLIRQNPKLLEPFGVTPEQFEAFVKSQGKGTTTQPGNKKTNPTSASPSPTLNGTSDLVASLLESQLNQALKPYESYIGPMVGILVFSTLGFFNYLMGFLLPLILWVMFAILEKSGFVHFEKEMREVKKLVV